MQIVSLMFKRLALHFGLVDELLGLHSGEVRCDEICNAGLWRVFDTFEFPAGLVEKVISSSNSMRVFDVTKGVFSVYFICLLKLSSLHLLKLYRIYVLHTYRYFLVENIDGKYRCTLIP